MKGDRHRRHRRILIVSGGAAGTLIRAGADQLTIGRGAIPWPTLLVNVVGSLALGWLVGRSLSRPAVARHLPLFGVGIMGALTTYGGMVVQLLAMVGRGAWFEAGWYLALSVFLGLAAGLVGLRVGAWEP